MTYLVCGLRTCACMLACACPCACVRVRLEWMNGWVYGWMEGSGCQESDLFCCVEMSAEFKKCSAKRDGATAEGKGTCTGHAQIRVVRSAHTKRHV